jgi:hypothetical protein
VSRKLDSGNNLGEKFTNKDLKTIYLSVMKIYDFKLIPEAF